MPSELVRRPSSAVTRARIRRVPEHLRDRLRAFRRRPCLKTWQELRHGAVTAQPRPTDGSIDVFQLSEVKTVWRAVEEVCGRRFPYDQHPRLADIDWWLEVYYKLT